MKLNIKLEHTYDIPFQITSGVNGYDPWYTVTPKNEDQSLFVIKLIFRNALRLIIDFEPQRYGANLVRSMGRANDEKKLAFCSYAKIMNQKGGKIEFLLNDIQLNLLDYTDWPLEWSKVRIRVTVMPISDIDSPKAIPYEDIADEWGRLTMGMILSLLDIIPLDGSEEAIAGYEEGNQTERLATKYERNPINRVLCLEKYGYKCRVCDFDFEQVYGDIGHEFIHVHHTVPVSRMGDNYIVNPLEDMVPVCPNCHAMIHKNNRPYTIEELKVYIVPAD